MKALLNGSLFARPETFWIPTVSDALAAFSYILLAWLVVRLTFSRKDLGSRNGFILISLFFLLAGALHVCNILAPWYRLYAVQSLLKLATAGFALLAFFVIWGVIPKLLSLPRGQQVRDLETKIVEAKMAQIEADQQRKKAEGQLQAKAREWGRVTGELEEEKNRRERTERLLQQMEGEAQLLLPVMEAIEEAPDFFTAVEGTVRKVCQTVGFEYGEAWIPRADGKVLECVFAWHGSDAFKEFFELSRELKSPPNMGLPGRVWASHQPLWIEDLLKAPGNELFQIEKAIEKGVRSVLGVPVMVGKRVAAVLVFFRLQPCEESRRLKDWIAALATHLGLVIQKRRIEEKLEETAEIIEKQVTQCTQELETANRLLQQEVAESRMAEESIRKSQENFQTLVNSIEGIVWEFDLRNSQFSFISRQTEKILGYPVEAWLSEPTFWEDHVHGADREAAVQFREEATRTKKDGSFEYRMITAEGKTLWMRDMVSVVVVNTQAVKLRGVMVNITERKQAEEALSEERNFVSTVLDTASAMVVILDTEGRIIRFNRACEQISGYSSDEIQSKFFWNLSAVPQEAAKIKKTFARLLAGQFPTNYESSWVAKDGTQKVIAWSSTALLSKYGHIIHIVATGIDITKRKEVEQKLTEAISDLAHSNAELDRTANEVKEANERLKRLDELKSHFISAASHELRTPLTSLKGYVETILLEEAGPINEKQKEFLGYVKESADRLHRLLNELLDISKIESGQTRMETSLTSLRELLRQEIMIFKPQADEKEIVLTLETDDDLRPIYCDADKIREVMDNLISNAIKYTARKGKVKILARNNGKGVKIDVQDTGIGIRKRDLPRIFEPFQHIEKNGTESEPSTGLGLTLAKRIVEAHDGQIQVVSEEGKGSTFTVLLPLGHETLEDRKISLAARLG